LDWHFLSSAGAAVAERKERERDPQHERHRQVGLKNVPSKDRSFFSIYFGIWLSDHLKIIPSVQQKVILLTCSRSSEKKLFDISLFFFFDLFYRT
jgi:hypothetical protein